MEERDKGAADAELKALLGEAGAGDSGAASRMLDRLSLGDEAASAVFHRRQVAAERAVHLAVHEGNAGAGEALARALGALAARLDGCALAAQLRAQASLQRAAMQAFLALDAAFAHLLASLLATGAALVQARERAAQEGATAAAALDSHRAFYADAAPGIEAKLQADAEAAGAAARACGDAMVGLSEGLRSPQLCAALEALPLELRQTLATRVQCLLPPAAARAGASAGEGEGEGEEGMGAAPSTPAPTPLASAFDPLLLPARLKASGLRSFSALTAKPSAGAGGEGAAGARAPSLPIPSLRHMSMFTLAPAGSGGAALAGAEAGRDLMRPLLRVIAPVLGRANSRSSGGGSSGGGGGGASASPLPSSAAATHLSLFDAGALFAPGPMPPVAAVPARAPGAGGRAAAEGGSGAGEGGRDPKRARTVPQGPQGPQGGAPPGAAKGKKGMVEEEEEEEEEEGEGEDDEDEVASHYSHLPADQDEGWCTIS